MDHQQNINQINEFIKNAFEKQKIDKAVIAMSGGIDSSLSLTLLSQGLDKKNIYPIFLPYGSQSTASSKLICKFNQIPKQNWQEINIQPMVDSFCQNLNIFSKDQIRKGNIMARVRMISIYDLAKKLSALVVGTENKSEKYLGYFTRFGDEASDLEPIQHLYKTQVYQLAKYLKLPQQIINQAPSAGLWENQTDEQELGFSYQQADQILEKLIDEQVPAEQIKIKNISPKIIKKVIKRVESQEFKHQVPYRIS